MGFYSRHLFPRLMDAMMRGAEFQRLRSALLAGVHGAVLEIGFGTGLNLPHYPATLSSLSIIDPAEMLPLRVAARISTAPFPVRVVHQTAESLPFPDHYFDTVVSTWTLCTIPDPVAALREVRRVLTPGGVFVFLEHGRSEDESVARWQDRLNPLQHVIACGCHLNRRIDRLIETAGFTITSLDRFTMESVPKIGGTMYRGRAVASEGEHGGGR